jgi:hypothetical protein
MNTQSKLCSPNLAVFTAGGYSDIAMYDNLASSTFTTVVLWSMHVDESGNIYIGNFGSDGCIAGAGSFNPGSNAEITEFQQKVLKLKGPASSITRIELSFGIGSYYSHGKYVEDQTFPNIMNLYNNRIKFPVPAANLIYNIQALQTALNLDAICFDDEVQYDQNSSLWLAQQCGSLGMTVSVCPFEQQSYWNQLVTAANAQDILIDAVYLQAWTSGGCQGWCLGTINPAGGMWLNEDGTTPMSPLEATTQLQAWQNTTPTATILTGGWYYNAGEIYASTLGTFSDYANAIKDAFS